MQTENRLETGLTAKNRHIFTPLRFRRYTPVIVRIRTMPLIAEIYRPSTMVRVCGRRVRGQMVPFFRVILLTHGFGLIWQTDCTGSRYLFLLYHPPFTLLITCTQTLALSYLATMPRHYAEPVVLVEGSIFVDFRKLLFFFFQPSVRTTSKMRAHAIYEIGPYLRHESILD